MAHITFIHGIGNKPPVESLCSAWRQIIENGELGLDLNRLGITTSMMYWADVLYPFPEQADLTADTVNPFERIRDLELHSEDLPQISPRELRFLTSVAAKFGTTMESRLDIVRGSSLGEVTPQTLLRIPLPWPIKRALLEAFLRDAHHYLFNKKVSPRPGEIYMARDEIRDRFEKALNIHIQDRPNIVIAHSLGSVIAYDCLKNTKSNNSIDELITLGSPLGLDEIQDFFGPSWSRDHSFPVERIRNSWTNYYDPLDPVDGFDPELRDDFQKDGVEVISDVPVDNGGLLRHEAASYLSQSALHRQLRDVIGIG